MKKFTNKNGHIIYKTENLEPLIWGGLCVCDICNRFEPKEGYLIPVLNYWVCEECYKEWETNANYYEEDKWYEDLICKRYENIKNIKIEVE